MNQVIDHPQNSTAQAARDKPFPSTANLSDALGQLGLKFQTLHSRIRPITGLPVRGPAFTVQCYPGANHAVEEALESAAPGDVLVINGEAFTEAVMMGGLMCGRAKQRGLAGVIIDGAVRDVAELRKLQWPVFASGITPRAGTFAKLGQLKVPVCCGNVVIQPGDMVAGDEDGIVAIPARALGKALTLACEIEKRESFITEAIERGLSIPEAAKEYEIRQG